MLRWLRNRAMDREITELLEEEARVKAAARDIRQYLLEVAAQNADGVEKFSDHSLARAAEIIEQVGPGAFYWMTDIAAQMVVLSEATLHGFATNVSVELGATATAQEIIEKVVRI